MTKHVSSGDDKAQSSQRDAATESLPTQTGTDDAQALSQGAADGHPVEAVAPDVAADAVVDAASGADRRSERNDARGNQTAPAATASAVRAAAAASSTADTRLAGAWPPRMLRTPQPSASLVPPLTAPRRPEPRRVVPGTAAAPS